MLYVARVAGVVDDGNGAADVVVARAADRFLILLTGRGREVDYIGVPGGRGLRVVREVRRGALETLTMVVAWCFRSGRDVELPWRHCPRRGWRCRW